MSHGRLVLITIWRSPDLAMSLHSQWLSSAQPDRVDTHGRMFNGVDVWAACIATPFSWYFPLSLKEIAHQSRSIWGSALSSCRIASSPISCRYGRTAVGWRISSLYRWQRGLSFLQSRCLCTPSRSPHHHAPSTKWCDALDAAIVETLTPSTPHHHSPINLPQAETRLVAEHPGPWDPGCWQHPLEFFMNPKKAWKYGEKALFWMWARVQHPCFDLLLLCFVLFTTECGSDLPHNLNVPVMFFDTRKKCVRVPRPPAPTLSSAYSGVALLCVCACQRGCDERSSMGTPTLWLEKWPNFFFEVGKQSDPKNLRSENGLARLSRLAADR